MTDLLQTLVSRLNLLAIALVMFSLSGCGGPPPAPTGTLSGTVKSGGELCGDCRITLYNPTSLKTKGGVVDESGTYEVKGIPFGDYDVSMYQTPTNAVVEVFDERIPKKFRNTKTSGLKVSITAEEPSVTFDIEM
ncbi:hypothetical protein N9Y42_07590 [Mariniblastus sp.]|nr:hypothetical protein [Mariniblastus sp.]